MSNQECPSILKAFSADMADRVLAGSSVKEFEPGEVIFLEGAPADHFYLIRSGKVAVEIAVGSQRTVCVQTLASGELFGWSAASSSGRFTASARAVERCVLLAVPAAALEEAFSREPAAGIVVLRNILRVVSTRLTDTRLQLINAAQW